MKTVILKVEVPDDMPDKNIICAGFIHKLMSPVDFEILTRPTDEEIYNEVESIKSFANHSDQLFYKKGMEIVINQIFGEEQK